MPSKKNDDGGYNQYGYHDKEPSLRPLVKVHPDTGRPNLCIGRHAYGIVGMDPEESEQLLDDLNEWACQPPRVVLPRLGRGRRRHLGQPPADAQGHSVRHDPAATDVAHADRRRARVRARAEPPLSSSRTLPADAGGGAGRGVRRARADDAALRRVRRRRRRRAHRQDRRLRVRLLEARGDVRAGASADAGARIRTATSSSPACGSCRRPSARSIRPPSESRPTRAPSTPTSSSSRSAPISTRRRRPGSSKAATSSTQSSGAFALRDVLAGFEGGRVIVGGDVDAVQVPARAERDRAARCTTSSRRAGSATSPRSSWSCRLPSRSRRRPTRRRRCSPRSPSGTSAGTRARWCAVSIPIAGSRCSATAREMPYDLFLGVPEAQGAGGRRGIGPCRRRLDPGRPVDACETSFPDVYAVGDVTSVGTPKAGVFAEGQAAVAAERHHRAIRGATRRPPSTTGVASATSSSATTRSRRST